MANVDLKSLTIKDLFQNSFGVEQGDAILKEIQAAHDQGLTGMALRHKAEEIVSKHVPRGVQASGDLATASSSVGVVSAGAVVAAF
jgi:hypothetical protein